MTGLIVFFFCAALLVGGYFVYGKIAERVFGVHMDLVMPCMNRADGVDYVPMPTWKVFLIQLLNIAGLGPVVGAVSGCLFGPAALLWIVLGCLLAGGVHDYMAALLSAHSGGKNLPELIGHWLGMPVRRIMRFVCVLMLVLVGVVFTRTPADMLEGITHLDTSLAGFIVAHSSLADTPEEVARVAGMLPHWWCIIILAYYFLATVLPVDAIIGRIYPFFALLFLVMAGGMLVRLPFCGKEVLPNLDFFTNYHPAGLPLWPMVFVTIACGAISGFHATQSPMMVRCLKEMRHTRPVFYGAMVVEGLVALVWATVGLTLHDELAGLSPVQSILASCKFMLGDTGAVVTVLGVVVLAVTSGDTAMRTCRLILADMLHFDQGKTWRRLLLALPLFAIVIVIFNIDFSILWHYFGWMNQLLACITLWSLSVMLRYRRRFYWITLVPAMFMTVMCTTYLLAAPECGICLGVAESSAAGLVLLVPALWLFARGIRRQVGEVFPGGAHE